MAHHQFSPIRDLIGEGFSPHQKVIDGKVFPKILLFSPDPYYPHDHGQQLTTMLDVLRSSRAFLEQQLHDFGAVLLRGLPLRSAADFNAAVEAIGWAEAPYLGTALRKQVVGRVYSASDAPPHLSIPFHHEMSQVKTSMIPSRVFFYCDVEPKEGGETPLVLSHKVTERMQEEFPDLVEKLEKEGVLYIKTLPSQTDPSIVIGQSWSTVFGTTIPIEAEKRASEFFGARLEWHDDGKVTMIGGPYDPIRAFDNEHDKKAWFNLVVAGVIGAEWKGKQGATVNGQYIVVYKDGTALPKEAVERCKQIHEEVSVDIPWRQGDIMILDNLAVMHGRRPCHYPRRVLVALSY